MPDPRHPGAGPLDVLVVSHTHWDREWYRTAGEFRQLLVALIDDLLDRPGTAPFLLDGQAILVDDYLDVRPERSSDLRRAFADGRLEAGPWFVLSDELIPSAEALVRNLLAGSRVLRRLGASPPPVLYSPDAFGHPAALPELAHGFGAGLAIVWRGYGGARWPAGDLVRWRAPSGRECVLLHLAPDGYEIGASLPIASDAATRRWRELRDILGGRSMLGIVLLPNGADHHARQLNLDRALAELGEAAIPDRVRAAGLAQLAGEIVSRAAAERLPSIRGELRDSYGYTWTLGGTLGARAAQKRANARVERLLVRDVEPWVAFLPRRGAAHSAVLVDACWRAVLLAHPHDSLCGCSTDDVATAVDARLVAAIREGEFLRYRTLRELLGHRPDLARSDVDAWRPRLIVRNRAPRPRSGVVEIEWDVPLAHVRVGPDSASLAPQAIPNSGSRSLHGLPTFQTLARKRLHIREESPRDYPRDELVERRRALTWIDAVPAYGMRVVPPGRGDVRAAESVVPASAGSASIANGVLSVEVRGDAIRLTAGARELPAFLSFESEADAGDLYTPSILTGSRCIGTLARWRVTAKGPWRSELTTWWTVPVAERTVHTATGERVRHRRTMALVEARLQLDAGASFVRIVVRGVWRASDARLRVRLDTGIASARTWADAMFGDVERARPELRCADRAVEQLQPGAPLHRFVSRYSARSGTTVFSDGLAEYEADDDASIAITLVRSTGDLSRAHLPERPGHAGWPTATPMAQSRGPYEATFALALHGPRTPDQVVAVHEMAEDVLLPIVGTTWRSAIDPPVAFHGIELAGRGLVFSCAKPGEDRSWTAVRCLNVLEECVEGSWRLPGAIDAMLARLDETPLGALPIAEGRVAFIAPPRSVVTILLRRWLPAEVAPDG